MNLDTAIRLTEILLGLSLIQQSLEHLISATNERRMFFLRIILAILLVVGVQTGWVSLLLLILSLFILQRFQGPYNGGADRMSLLILSCLLITKFAPSIYIKEVAFGYLALQLILSYFISGWVKIKNPEWRSGQALQDVFQFSAYPVSESLRTWSNSPRMLLSMSWGVIIIELLFPLSLVSGVSLMVALIITASFHFSNACLFGLNRFFWIWIAAYPSIIWFQQRIFSY